MGMRHSKISVEESSWNRADFAVAGRPSGWPSWLSETNPPTLGGNK
jgi:hypothetical protein